MFGSSDWIDSRPQNWVVKFLLARACPVFTLVVFHSLEKVWWITCSISSIPILFGVCVLENVPICTSIGSLAVLTTPDGVHNQASAGQLGDALSFASKDAQYPFLCQ